MIEGVINQVRFGNVHTGPFLDIHSVHVVHEDRKRRRARRVRRRGRGLSTPRLSAETVRLDLQLFPKPRLGPSDR